MVDWLRSLGLSVGTIVLRSTLAECKGAPISGTVRFRVGWSSHRWDKTVRRGSVMADPAQRAVFYRRMTTWVAEIRVGRREREGRSRVFARLWRRRPVVQFTFSQFMPTSATDVQPTQPSALTPTLALTLSRNVVSEHLSRNVVSEHESISSPYSKMYPKTTSGLLDADECG